MPLDNFDKIAKAGNVLDRLDDMEMRNRATTRRNVKSARLSNLSPEMGEVDFRAVDTDGNLRVVMSAYDLFDELGVHAHLAGLDTLGDVQFYLSADDGKAYFAGGQAYIDTVGIHMSAETYPSSAYLDWLADDTGALIGEILASYGGALTNSGLLLIGKAHDSGVHGLVYLNALTDTGVVGQGPGFVIDSRGIATLTLDGSVDTTGTQSLAISTNIAATNEVNTVLYLYTKSKGTVANGLGTAIILGIEDSAGVVEYAGQWAVEWLDKTSGSEDAVMKWNMMKQGVLTTHLRVNEWGMVSRFPAFSHEMVTPYITDWIVATGSHGWGTTAVGAGTIAGIEDVASHHGIVQASQNGADTGHSMRIPTGSTLLLQGGEYCSGVFRLQNTTNCEYRFGIHDVIGVAVDATDGVYISISGTTLSGKTANNSTRSSTGTTYTVSTATWYRMKVVVNSNATRVDYYLYDAAGALLWTNNLTTNIPTASGRGVGIGFTGYKTTAGTVALFDLDWCAFGSENVITR